MTPAALLQMGSAAPAAMETHMTFVYIHLQPFRRHVLQVESGGRVLLLSGQEYRTSSSEWHGEHDHRMRGQLSWRAMFHYAVEGALLRRRLMMVLDVRLGESCTYVAYHADRRCCLGRQVCHPPRRHGHRSLCHRCRQGARARIACRSMANLST